MITEKLDRKVLTLVHTTEAGKELHLVTAAGSANKVFQWSGGGEVPHKLSGIFTDTISAKNAMNRWLADKPSPTLSPEGALPKPPTSVEPGFIEGLLSNAKG